MNFKNFNCYYSQRLLKQVVETNIVLQDKILNINEIKKAIFYAKKHHGNQKRETGEPYYSHPLEVAFMFLEFAKQEDIKYCNTNLVVTAILHDTLEDTNLTFFDIKNIFGELVANHVMDLTRITIDNNKMTSADILTKLWKEKKYDLLTIKLIDRLHNMNTIHVKPQEKIIKIVNETLNFFLVFAMHMENKTLEKIIYEICSKAISITDNKEI